MVRRLSANRESPPDGARTAGGERGEYSVAVPVRTSVESVDTHKVKLHVEVDAPTFDKAVDAAFRKLASEVRIPGFRKGKVPRRVLETRMGGTGALREEALKDALPQYFDEAVKAESLDP